MWSWACGGLGLEDGVGMLGIGGVWRIWLVLPVGVLSWLLRDWDGEGEDEWVVKFTIFG
jgi:hypothetical protein